MPLTLPAPPFDHWWSLSDHECANGLRAPLAVERFVFGLAARLLPAASPATLAATLAAVGDRWAPANVDAEGARVSAVTARGVAFEASVRVTGSPDAPVRYVVEPGAGHPFFATRWGAQRAVVRAVARQLPAPAAAAARVLDEWFDVVVSDPGGVPARTRRGAYVGVVPAPDGTPAALKLYLPVAIEPTALGRVLARAPDLAHATGGLLGWPALTARLAAVEVGPGGQATRKLYFGSTRRLAERDVAELLARTGVDARWVLERARPVIGARLGRTPVFVCCAIDGAGATTLSVHASARTLGPDQHSIAAGVRALARFFDGREDRVDALVDAGHGCGVPWSFTMIGLGLAPPGHTPKLNVYAAPHRLS